ncbi:4Fe-4S dicluster domain-containing protein [Acetonema longum]|uniref:Hydrogenase, 4fe-4S ferredoxin-type component n=1 Tax=Acetonema longum DSM 6540 TaxID=1009370 RepID=F7NGS4_9FIRM|nr:4Fe-4S dicluster domain-containing protein [Acetonema longum]EGO64655.1 hydrogenase, 4fe-4S ferredoxin-type component [Acetonema longum DSM 6540]
MKQHLLSFIIADQSRCTGCKTCEVACHAWHHPEGKTAGTATGPVLPKIWIRRTQAGGTAESCRQCEGAPCAGSCTRGAVRFCDGRVRVDTAFCQSCPDCVLACPFGAIRLAPKRQGGAGSLRPSWVADKCDLCRGRDQGPVCVESCPEKALRLVEPLQERREKNLEAARIIRGLCRGRR